LFKPSLRANGSRECAPDDRLREAIQLLCSDKEKRKLDCFVASLKAAATIKTVVARLDRAIQYAEASHLSQTSLEYWVARSAGR
jgi:hypothetical protein